MDHGIVELQLVPTCIIVRSPLLKASPTLEEDNLATNKTQQRDT
jgi:hypothetical protein